jgi:site-specific recombinase XerD
MDTQGFTNYLQGKNLSPATQHLYLRSVKKFFKWAQKEDLQVTKPDILKFLEYLNNKGLSSRTRRHYLGGLNYYFACLCESEQISVNPCSFLKMRGTKIKRLHKIYTLEELETLFDNFYQIFVRNVDYSRIKGCRNELTALCRERNALILSFIIYQRATTGETENIELGDIDFFKATIKIRGIRRGNDKKIPLNAVQTGLLANYLQNIRPKLAEIYAIESDRLFFLPSVSSVGTVFDLMEKQIKTIDRQFLSFKQLRASTLCYWIKTHGLRKAQYLAGHRYVSSTENYLGNNLEELIDDINKLHPF